jgi:nitroreductase
MRTSAGLRVLRLDRTPCLEGGTPTRTSGSSIYPAAQNMLLAARALGLGATLTTPYLQFEKEAEAALGLPPGFQQRRSLLTGTLPFQRERGNRPMPSGAIVAQSFPNDTAMEMPYRPVPEQSHAE